jgi:hypothetical protein
MLQLEAANENYGPPHASHRRVRALADWKNKNEELKETGVCEPALK